MDTVLITSCSLLACSQRRKIYIWSWSTKAAFTKQKQWTQNSDKYDKVPTIIYTSNYKNNMLWFNLINQISIMFYNVSNFTICYTKKSTSKCATSKRYFMSEFNEQKNVKVFKLKYNRTIKIKLCIRINSLTANYNCRKIHTSFIWCQRGKNDEPR